MVVLQIVGFAEILSSCQVIPILPFAVLLSRFFHPARKPVLGFPQTLPDQG
jgi:hypothetical protein